MSFSSKQNSTTVFCTYNSSLFRWFLDVTTDGSHLNKWEIEGFQFDPESMENDLKEQLMKFGAELRTKLLDTSQVRVMKYKHDTLTVQCILPKNGKDVIDQIDTVLAQHYGFTEEELDFIINYDIKYRMGKTLFGEEDNEEEGI